jgi:hypothetical protein
MGQVGRQNGRGSGFQHGRLQRPESPRRQHMVDATLQLRQLQPPRRLRKTTLGRDRAFPDAGHTQTGLRQRGLQAHELRRQAAGPREGARRWIDRKAGGRRSVGAGCASRIPKTVGRGGGPSPGVRPPASTERRPPPEPSIPFKKWSVWASLKRHAASARPPTTAMPRDPSPCSPANGPTCPKTCPSKNSPRSSRRWATTASSSPAGATTSTLSRRFVRKKYRPRQVALLKGPRPDLLRHLQPPRRPGRVRQLIDERHQSILPADVWGNGEPEGVRKRAAER